MTNDIHLTKQNLDLLFIGKKYETIQAHAYHLLHLTD